MLIIEFYRYILYRTYHALIHFGWPRADVFSHTYLGKIPQIYPFLNLESLYLILAYFTVGTISKTNLLVSLILCFLIYIAFMFKLMPKVHTTEETEEFYEELNRKYENEKHRIIKGYLVVLFMFFSWIVIIGLEILVVSR